MDKKTTVALMAAILQGRGQSNPKGYVTRAIKLYDAVMVALEASEVSPTHNEGGKKSGRKGG